MFSSMSDPMSSPLSEQAASVGIETFWKNHLVQGLAEDDWQNDWTSLGLVPQQARAKIIAKSRGVWSASGLNIAVEDLSKELKSPVVVESGVSDGDVFEPALST